MNVRTIREEHKQIELKYNFEYHNIDIQEHKIIHDEKVRYKTIGRSIFITTSAWRNDQGAPTEGIGIILNNRSRSSLSEIISHTDRIQISTFQGNPTTSIIVIYSPTNSYEDEVIDRLYEELRGSIESIPQHNLLAIIEDCNSRIGKDDGTFTYHQHTHINWLLLLDISSNILLMKNNY